MKSKRGRNLLLGLLGMLGSGALLGGAVLVISPSGHAFGMPLSLLAHSPFSNFFIPGIILFVILGLAPLVVLFALIKRPECELAEHLNFYSDMYWGWTYCIFIAFALIIWIQFEMVFIQAVHWSHTVYMFLAIAILFCALLPVVRNEYKK